MKHDHSPGFELEFRDLRLAVTASQHRSLRRAAEALNLRQSTLSRRLRDIERRLGVVLFERSNSGTRLSQLGFEFVASAGRILEQIDEELRRLKSRSAGKEGTLTIGVHASLSAGPMRAGLCEFRRRLPDVEVRTIDGSHDRLLRALAAEAIDIAITSGPSSAWSDRMLPLWSERVIAALPENHALGRACRARWPDLADEKFLLPQQGPGQELENLIAIKLRNAAATDRIVRQDVSLDRLLSLVGAGYGALLMFEGATGVRYEGVVYHEVCDDDGPTRVPFTAYWRAANGNPALQSFLSMLREHHPDLSPEVEPD